MTIKHTKATIGVRPPLKWAGGKYLLLNQIKTLLPAGKRLVEPFAGSCVLSLNTPYAHYWVNDSNRDLINFYQTLKLEQEAFIRRAKRYFTQRYNNAESYYRLRDEFNDTMNVSRRALLFLYLNRHAFNGLCRYNNMGRFNTPFGRYDKAYFPEQELKNFMEHSSKMKFTCMDFSRVIEQTKAGDIIYCDPPYVPLSKTAKFTKYAGLKFELEQHEHLVELLLKAKARGVPAIISNHSVVFTRALYAKADKIKKIKVPRFISCNGNARKQVNELLALYLPN